MLVLFSIKKNQKMWIKTSVWENCEKLHSAAKNYGYCFVWNGLGINSAELEYLSLFEIGKFIIKQIYRGWLIGHDLFKTEW